MNRLLLVEDDPTSRSFLQAASAALPADVDVAGTAEDAYVLACVNCYDVWLIDANLPDGRGSGLLARLRADGLATPAIAHTAARERRALDALRADGFVLAMSKPVTADIWRGAIRRVLDRQRAAEPPPSAPAQADSAGGPAGGLPLLWNRDAALAAVAGDAGNARGLQALFLDELDAVRTRIASAVDAGDVDAIRDVLHRLRAGCGFVGAERLGLAARHLHAQPMSAPALHTFFDTVDATRAGSVERPV